MKNSLPKVGELFNDRSRRPPIRKAANIHASIYEGAFTKPRITRGVVAVTAAFDRTTLVPLA
jgi:hypothetical protein